MLSAMSLLIGEIFRRNAQVVPDQVAASMGDVSLTHRELDLRANRLARVLADKGVRAGDRVVTWADTGLDVLPLFAALAKLGAVFAPINARFGPDEASDVAALARAELLVADAARAEAAEVVAKAARIPRVARLGGEPGPGVDLHGESSRASDATLAPPGIAETDPHVIFFTSGSTGRPKGVVLSHRANFLRTFQGVFRDVPERSVCMFPLFHMAAFTLALAAWQTRGEIAFVESATAEALLSTIEKRRGNRFYGIPAIWNRILETDLSHYDLSSLREADTGTSATPPELIAALKERFPNTATRIYYGSTECGAGTALPDADVLRKPGSVGPPAPGVDLRITSAGEIQVRSAYLMDGYFDNPEATAAALEDGSYRTGDLGALDDEGYLSVTGRLREVIRTGGETVAPSEVESVLAGCAGVAEIAVVGLPDAQWGEVVCAVVVPDGNGGPSLEDLQRHCETKLAGFKKPRRMERVESLPRTAATGQIQRTLLVEQIASRGSH
jgi:acyl-CoA synthetase (AMP-forming)/AMP-acid ligase II